MRIHSMPCAPRGRTALLLLSSVSLLAVTSQTLAQSTSNTQLPPVDIEQSKAKAAAKKKAAKTQAQPPASAPAPLAASAETTDTPEEVIDGRKVQQTTAGPVDGYRALTQSTGTKSETPIAEVPQSIAVIPGTVLADQKSNDVREALTNVSGVVPQSSLLLPLYDVTIIRGYSDQSTRTWIDGLPVSWGAGDISSSINVERVEVLKGPTGMLYGGGVGSPVGGAINIVSKMPEDRRFGKIGVTIGSHDYVRPFFDINEPINPNIQVRVTGDYVSADSHIDVIDTDKWNLNPTIRFDDLDGTVLTVQGRVSRLKQHDYQGLPAVGTVAGGFRLRSDLFIGPEDLPRSYSNQDSVTVGLDKKMSPAWTLHAKARLSQAEFEERAVVATTEEPQVPPSSWQLPSLNLYQEQDEISTTAHSNLEFTTAFARHKWSVGADYSRLEDEGFVKFTPFFPFVLPAIDIAASNVVLPPYVDPYDGPNDLIMRTTTAGAWTQLQSSFYDVVHVTAGARVAHISQSYDRNVVFPFASLASFDIEDTKVLPRVGVVVDVTSALSLFAGYSEGLKAQPFSNLIGTPALETSDQIEVGTRLNIANQFSASLAFFEITRQNVAIGSPISKVAAGEDRSKGVEVDATWQIGPAWKLIANYAYTDAEYTNTVVTAFTTVVDGNALPGVPMHSGRAWINYEFQDAMLKGLSVGAGVYAASGSFVDFANLYKTDAFYTVDAKVAYETPSWEAALAFKNLTDQKYYQRLDYFNGRVYEPDGLAVFGTFAYKY